MLALGLIKPHLILLVPVLLLLHRRWRALGAVIITTAGPPCRVSAARRCGRGRRRAEHPGDPVFATHVQAAHAWKKASVPDLIFGLLRHDVGAGWQLVAYAAGLAIAARAIPSMVSQRSQTLRPWVIYPRRDSRGVTARDAHDLIRAIPLVVKWLIACWTSAAGPVALTSCCLWLMPGGPSHLPKRPWPLSASDTLDRLAHGGGRVGEMLGLSFQRGPPQLGEGVLSHTSRWFHEARGLG